MPPVKRRPCITCGRMHGCHSIECGHCECGRITVAKHFGILITEIPLFMSGRREEADERRSKFFNRTNRTARVAA